jgi:hypothetical protein
MKNQPSNSQRHQRPDLFHQPINFMKTINMGMLLSLAVAGKVAVLNASGQPVEIKAQSVTPGYPSTPATPHDTNHLWTFTNREPVFTNQPPVSTNQVTQSTN